MRTVGRKAVKPTSNDAKADILPPKRLYWKNIDRLNSARRIVGRKTIRIDVNGLR